MAFEQEDVLAHLAQYQNSCSQEALVQEGLSIVDKLGTPITNDGLNIFLTELGRQIDFYSGFQRHGEEPDNFAHRVLRAEL